MEFVQKFIQVFEIGITIISVWVAGNLFIPSTKRNDQTNRGVNIQ